jgi:hypothetical protein
MATARTTVGAIGIKVWVYKGDLVTSLKATREKVAAEAALASGGPGRVAPAKARAEQAVGGERGSKVIEAGGGKRLIEAGGGKREGKRLIEAGGGKRIAPDVAKSEYEEEVETVEGLATDDSVTKAPAGEETIAPGTETSSAAPADEAVTEEKVQAVEETQDAPAETGAPEEPVTSEEASAEDGDV